MLRGHEWNSESFRFRPEMARACGGADCRVRGCCFSSRYTGAVCVGYSEWFSIFSGAAGAAAMTAGSRDDGAIGFLEHRNRYRFFGDWF
jgi:hypothetical protein